MQKDKIIDGNAHFFWRFLQYQKERFPFLLNGIAVTVFTFSAISYSRICRNEEGFISVQDFLIGCFATFTLFFLIRIFDEFKDQKEDALYRKYLPVPRGLISLKELKFVAIVITVFQFSLLIFFQFQMLGLYLLAMFYLVLMRFEFFFPSFLKERQILYVTSHMLILPILDLYSSGLDWKLENESPHFGLVFFLIVSFFNGILVEFGRKFKAPHLEEEGVTSYTKMWGTKGAAKVWLMVLATTLLTAIMATVFAGYGGLVIYILIGIALFCCVPVVSFIYKPNAKNAKRIEQISGIWTILMYLILGTIPMISNLIA